MAEETGDAGSALRRAADELYGLAPEAFTARRNELARAARPEDRALATAIGALRRPSAAAWLVNQLARRRTARLDPLLGLGDDMRDAQGAGDRGELNALSRRRRELLAELRALAADLAGELGAPASAAVLDDVGRTLAAATVDAGAAAAVRSGRLVRALEAVGVDVDLAGAVAGGPPAARPDPPAPADLGARRRKRDAERESRDAGPRAPRSDAARERRRAAADREWEEARAHARQARETLDGLEDRLEGLRADREDAAGERADLERRLEELEEELQSLDRRVRATQRDRDRAARESDRAERAAEQAERARAALDD